MADLQTFFVYIRRIDVLPSRGMDENFLWIEVHSSQSVRYSSHKYFLRISKLDLDVY